MLSVNRISAVFALISAISATPGLGQAPTPTPDPIAHMIDLNQDGVVDGKDAILFQEAWQVRNIQTPTPSPTATATPLAPCTGPDCLTVDIAGLPEGARPLRFVRVPAGSFNMGSEETENGRQTDEWPVHNVTLSQDFFMSETEITQGQWEGLMGPLPTNLPGGGGGEGHNYPVYFVTWDQAQAFAEALSIVSPDDYRLPSEAEWEYACRGGTQARFFFGDSTGIDCNEFCLDCAAGTLPGNRSDYMWYCWSADMNGFSSGAKEVATLLPNQFGLFDMSGNIWEWCADWYHESYVNAPDDGSAWVSPAGTQRILRGGYRNSFARFCRSADRGNAQPFESSINTGFRLVRIP